ncbi:MAG: FAD-dependent oxidoreductase [Deltaproteobacteria bacterium]|nr:FAD-dependent oxidoreductase [Deltaproteobacteria bacterium]
MRTAVIGAGAAGITAAYELSKAGHSVDVFEAAPVVGGLGRSFDLWGQRVDLGPHRFFSCDARINRLWLEVIGRDYAMIDRLTRIYYRKRFFHYPLKPFDALSNLGGWESTRCLASYATEKFRTRAASHDLSFEQWVTSRFGRRLFEVFFKTYSEKLWGISCEDLDADFAAQRIKKLSLLEAIKNAFQIGTTQHKTLVDRFAYPKEGSGALYTRMAAFIERKGHKVYLNSPIQRLMSDHGHVTGVELSTGEKRLYDHVVSTMPLTLLVKSLSGVPDSVRAAVDGLSFRNTILVYLEIDSKNLFPDNWIYVHSPELQTGRITNFRNWVPELHRGSENSILALEYWCNRDDTLWSDSHDSLAATASAELRKTGLIGKANILRGHVERLNRCYPVYRRGYKTLVSHIAKWINGINNLTPIGRYGSFKYNNQDHSLLMGLLAAEKINQGAKHNLWDINTDYESYQESAVITELGLRSEHQEELPIPTGTLQPA